MSKTRLIPKPKTRPAATVAVQAKPTRAFLADVHGKRLPDGSILAPNGTVWKVG